MDDLYISTYFLNSFPSKTRHDYRFGNLILKAIDFKYTETLPFKKMQEAIRDAKENNDNAVVIVQNDEFEGERQNLLGAIGQMVTKRFYLMAIHAECESRPFQIGNDLAYVSQFSKLNSFLISCEAYDFILTLTDDKIIKLWPRKSSLSLEFVLNEIFIKKCLLLPNRKADVYCGVNQATINVIVPFRNVERFLAECCDSLIAQKYSNYKVFFIDDCSEDSSVMKIPKSPNFFILRNTNRKYALHNIVDVLRKSDFDPEDIIAVLDGDDKLTHEYVFSLLNTIYCTEQCLVTYGSFKISGRLIEHYFYTKSEFEALRLRPWKASHLKTFKFKVFIEYIKQDPGLSHLRDKHLKFYMVTYDQALMLPFLEIVGFDRVRFVKDRVYDYRIHSHNDHNVNSTLQTDAELEIRSKASFNRRFFD